MVNPSPGITTSGFNTAGSYLVNYTTTTGVVNLYGDYLISGSTFTLDYSNRLYVSTATTPMVMVGAEAASGFVVNWTSDTYAVSQLIMMQDNGSNWVITGSSTTGTLCTISNAGGTSNCPTSNPQFNLTVPTSLTTGDRAVFG